MTKIAGLDWSMSSPGLCITGADGTIYLYGQSGKKKDVGVYNISENGYNLIFTVELLEKHDNNAQRFKRATNRFLNHIKTHNCTDINLEGYAMGSGRGGMTFTIGESTGFLKSALYDAGLKVNIVAPTSLKKFATGKGNANKDKMYEAFVNLLSINLPDVACRSDVVDAYWLQTYNEQFYEQF